MLPRGLGLIGIGRIRWLWTVIARRGRPSRRDCLKVIYCRHLDEIVPVKTKVKDKTGKITEVLV